MIVLAAAAVLIVVVVLGGLSFGLLSSRPSDGASLLAIGGGALLVLVVGAVVLAGVGLGVRGGGDEEDAAPVADTSTTTTATSTTVTTTAPPTPTAPEATDLGVRGIAVHASSGDDFPPPPSVLDRLPSRTVLRVSATGFEPLSSGVIEQCTAGGCSNAFPVSFDEGGNELLQYLARDDFSVAGQRASCDPDGPPCVVRVSSGEAAAYFATVFGGAAPAPRTVAIDTPAGGIADGDTVEVAVSGFTPGERVQAVLCAAPATFGAARCGAPGPVAPFTVDDDGSGRTSLVVDRGRVGTNGVACGRDAPCGVAVASAGTFVPAPVAPITFAAGPTVTYDVTRVLLGVLVAAFLLALATYLVRTTDWRKPTEADTPALDSAVL